MDITQRYDPELVVALQVLQGRPLVNWNDLPGSRQTAKQTLAALEASTPNSTQVTKEDRTVPGPQGAPAVSLRIYRPGNLVGPKPVLLWIHGGGYVSGTVGQNDALMQHTVEEVGCVAISVEYRLAPEHPFPAPLEDCHAILTWIAEEALALDIDPTRIAVAGTSAGGGLAAALVQLARDQGKVKIAFCVLISPMLDDRDRTLSSEVFANAPVWSRQDNRKGWRAFLGDAAASAEVPPYAAAARATNLTNLPPTYIAVGSGELFLDEDVAYAQRLALAGVPIELHIYPRAFHGWSLLAPGAALSQRLLAEWNQALRHAWNF
jgi:acetyl esterase/lipase